jgi:Arc/MetJ-type ribon-helix-helix transcriptional regulator
LKTENTGVYVGSKIPSIIRHSIHKAVSCGSYLNISDFVRDAIKEKLEREGYLSIDRGVIENCL